MNMLIKGFGIKQISLSVKARCIAEDIAIINMFNKNHKHKRPLKRIQGFLLNAIPNSNLSLHELRDKNKLIQQID